MPGGDRDRDLGLDNITSGAVFFEPKVVGFPTGIVRSEGLPKKFGMIFDF